MDLYIFVDGEVEEDVYCWSHESRCQKLMTTMLDFYQKQFSVMDVLHATLHVKGQMLFTILLIWICHYS